MFVPFLQQVAYRSDEAVATCDKDHVHPAGKSYLVTSQIPISGRTGTKDVVATGEEVARQRILAARSMPQVRERKEVL